MNVRLARQILRRYRPSGEDDQDRDVRAAVKFATRHPALETEFHQQLSFDRAVASRLEELPLPDGLPAELEGAALAFEAKRRRRFSFRDPAVLAVSLAFLCLVGLVTWIALGQGSFAGLQEVSEMVTAGDGAGPDQFSEIETNAGGLTDWFVMKDFDGFIVAPGMESAPVAGVRLFKFDDVPVAAAVITHPKALVYVFDAQPLGISLGEGRWHIASYGAEGKRAFAIRQIGTKALVVTLREGGRPALEHYLSELNGRN